MKVFAINSSPMMGKGNTARILEPFLEGMRGAGAGVELVYTKKLDINPCHGEFNCWAKTPGVCYQDDDMQTLLPKLREAEVWVLATPVFVDGISGPMKDLLDRFIPLIQPFVELRDGHCRHPLREGTERGKLVGSPTAASGKSTISILSSSMWRRCARTSIGNSRGRCCGPMVRH